MTFDSRALSAPDLPVSLLEKGRERLDRFLENRDDVGWLMPLLEDEDFAAQLLRVWSCSPFVFESCLLAPETFRELVDSGDLARSCDDGDFRQRLQRRLADCEDEKQLHARLRRFRRREMIRLVWRDFCRLAPMLETTGDVTRLAETCIGEALAFLHQRLAQQMGEPVGEESGEPQRMVVLGMGKMGAWELNVSSDIDLIFAFREGGETRGGRRQVSNQEFFIRLGQRLIQALDSQTADGFVFRVDMRLRPYGESGTLALSFDAMEEYFQNQGRDWERYAMVKARPVAGRPEDGEALMAILRPFTYRKYIDFTAIQSLRDMKALINREVARLGITDDIKKSSGGIREVEFVAQAFQLIRGGKDLRFQNPVLRDILALLGEEGMLPASESEQLWAAYEFLRNTEHALQGREDRQTQRLPEDEEDRTAVAALLGFGDDWTGFCEQLEAHREVVRRIFAGIAAESEEERTPSDAVREARALWQGAPDEAAAAEELAALGLSETEEAGRALYRLRESRTVQAMTAGVRDRLDTFIPLLLAHCLEREAEHPGDGAVALVRLLPLVESILRRSAYMVLMIENPGVLRQLVYLCAESAWIAEQVGRYPALLDELLDPRSLYTPMDKEGMALELADHLRRVPADDLERQMETLRYFRLAQSLRVAACEVEGVLPLMKASDNLTWLAEVILDQVVAMARAWMEGRHGRPGTSDPATPEPGLLVVGYGKLGGIELGHGSDLDLVFLHDAEAGLSTDGERPVDNATFFMRMGQRIVHILTTQTLTGALYEVDMRLRPNGNSGMLVTTVPAFERYQEEGAWTWEHQALVRARPVAGDTRLAPAFEQTRRRVLCRERDTAALREEVIAMRDRMREHLGSSARDRDQGEFHLKQDAGGIVDIEFMVQFAVLANAGQFPDLTRWTDNMRIIASLEANGILSSDDAAGLRDAYIAYRSATHRLQLDNLGGSVPEAGFGRHRDAVSDVYGRLLGSGQGAEGERD